MSCLLPDCTVAFALPDCVATFSLPDCVVAFTLHAATACFADATGGLIDVESAFVLDETGAIIYEG